MSSEQTRGAAAAAGRAAEEVRAVVGSGGVDPWRIRGGAEPREAPEARRQLGAAASAVAASTRAGAGEGARRVAAASVEAEPVRKWRRRGSAGMAALGGGGARGDGAAPR